ncbi:MAG: formylglycine-generating enzyme family protein [Opitutae bacterium]|jgi:formylglycine-generating enzyme required for sulfatase activity|nr:formylglycine-generating enzyme family protein [Opitutae bacterium]
MVKYIFSISFFFIIGCSEPNNISTSDNGNYVPFPSDKMYEVNEHEFKKLNARKNYILVKPGEFWMGSPVSEPGRNQDESKHLVRISKPFLISKFELTNQEWNANVPTSMKKGSRVYELTGRKLKKMCVGENFLDGNFTITNYEKKSSQGKYSLDFFFEEVVPNSGTRGNWEIKEKDRKNYQLDSEKFLKHLDITDYLKEKNISSHGIIGEKNPVTRVSHSQATAYCWKQSTRAHKEGRLPKGLIYRLPTEAEWEYACRAGTTGICGLGSGERLSGVNACLNGSRAEYVLGGEVMLINRRKVAPIDVFKPKYSPNAWGIHDMHGNVMEWCHDYYSPYGTKNKTVDPLGFFNGSRRVVRGGSFYRTAQQCRSASRASYEPSYRGSEIGFRMVIGYRLL